MLSATQLEAWKKKRKWTVIMFAVHRVVFGVQYSNIFSTLWIYLTTLVHTDNPHLWYGLISVSFHISGTILTLMVGRIVDKRRNIRSCYLVCTALTVIGNVLYSIPYSVYYVLAGRFITGAIVATRPIVVGEVARVYEKGEVLRMLSLQGMCFGFGLTMGPALNFLFVKFDYTIWNFHMTYANAPSLFLSVVFVILEIMIFYLIHDVSKEYDLKEDHAKQHNAEQENTKRSGSKPDKVLVDVASEESKGLIKNNRADYGTNCTDYGTMNGHVNSEERDHYTDHGSINSRADYAGIEPPSQYDNPSLLHSEEEMCNPTENTALLQQPTVPSICKLLKRMTTNFDSVFVVFFSLLLNILFNSSDLWTPLLVTEVLKWGVVELNAIFFGSGVCSILVAFFVAVKKMSPTTYYNLNLCAIIGLVMLEVCLFVLKVYHRNFYLNVELYVIYSILFGLTISFEDAFLSNTLAQMLPSNVQSLGESIRLTCLRVAAVVSLFTGALVFHWMEYVSAGIAFTLLLMFFTMIIRRKHIISPKCIL